MKQIRYISKTIMTLMFVLIASGCSNYNRETIDVCLNQTLAKDTVQVDIAGIKEKDVETYYKVNSSDYWKLNSKFRRDLARYTIVFCPEKSSKGKLSANDPIWNIWNYMKCNYLLVTADLPPTVGNSTNWKQIIPLNSFMWFNFWSNKTCNFEISDCGLSANSRSKPTTSNRR